MLCVKGCGLVGETQSSIRARGSVFVSGIVRQFLSVSPPPLAMSVTPDPLTDTEAAVDNVCWVRSSECGEYSVGSRNR